MIYEYRVLIELLNGDTDAMHFSSEKLYPGAIFRVHKPGTHINGTPVIVRKVDSHPSENTPGIAHAHVEEVNGSTTT
jgi:hypothetical protein